MSKKLNVLLITLVSAIIILLPINAHAAGVVTPGVTYRTQVQNVGWQSYVSDGTTSGTVGRSLRLEAINIKGTNLPAGVGITYEVQCQNTGWSQGWVSNGVLAGTVGKSLRLEAIRINLTGANAAAYSVEYQTQVQNIGWQGFVKDGYLSGTVGRGLRLEGIQIKIVPKGYMDVAQGIIINDLYKGRYYLCINSITQVGLQPYCDNTGVAEVYKINYSYKVLSHSVNDEDLWIGSFDSVLDGSGLAGNSSYDYGNPVWLSTVNSVCTTDTYVSVNKATSSLRLIENYYNANFTEGHYTYTIQTK